MWINEIIRLAAERNLSTKIYNWNMLFSCLVVLFFMLFYRRKYNISINTYLWSMLILYPVGYLWMVVYAWAASGFQKFGGGNIVRIFIYYPIFLYPVYKMTGVRLRTLLDYISPGLALLQGLDHISCIFPGCCRGYSAPWGIWNIVVKDYLFPNQWLESAVSFIIFLILMRKSEKDHYCGNGNMYALFLILFGATRFLLEFLRDNNKLFLGISNLAWHAAFMVVVGVLYLFYLRKTNKK